ncbi:MAG TPA: PDZ domain-containing protein [Pirellulales bacterium]|nr:PDZ domain-containing protein [Pirellulales bacterium]
MLKKLSLTAIAIVACLTPLADQTARGQTIRQEGRIEARAARQAGRASARTFGDFGNRGYYYGPGGFYGPAYGTGGYYRGSPYYGGGPGYYGNYGGPANGGFAGPRYGGYYAGPAYNGGFDGSRGQRAYLGITMSETPDGVVRVSGIRPNSPADEAGIRPGDVLLALDGREIYSSQDVTRMVARHVPGEAVRLDIDRNGRNDQLQAVLASAPGQFVGGPAPRATYPSEYPVDRSEYPAYVEPYEILPAPMQARRAPNAYINAY